MPCDGIGCNIGNSLFKDYPQFHDFVCINELLRQIPRADNYDERERAERAAQQERQGQEL